jgi:hypothetical protein
VDADPGPVPEKAKRRKFDYQTLINQMLANTSRSTLRRGVPGRVGMAPGHGTLRKLLEGVNLHHTNFAF